MYKFRIKIFMALAGVVVLGVFVRLGYLQIVESDNYRLCGWRMLRSFKVLPAARGRILDQKGKVLADNRACYDFCLDFGLLTKDEKERSRWIRRQRRKIARDESVTTARAGEILNRRMDNTWRLADRIAGSLGVDLDTAIARIRRRVEAIRQAHGGPVREQYQAHSVISGLAAPVSTYQTVGASVRPSLNRYYPYGPRACHAVGLIGRVNRKQQKLHNLKSGQADLLTRRRKNYYGGDLIGKSGMEKTCEQFLRGLRGYRRFDNRTDTTLEFVPAEHGKDIHLTIDIEMQGELENLLRFTANNGSIVAISIPTGHVLAMVSMPNYDLNSYRRNFTKLAKDELNFPLRSRSVARLYPPGSVIKPLAALAGLESGAITSQTIFHCRGYLHTPDAFRCSNRSGHGDLDLVGAITHSCNIYFYEIANRIGADALIEWYNMFGLSQLPGTGLPEEMKGRLPKRSWLARHPGPGQARFLAIGQGPIVVTPMHIANMMATLARKGKHLSPLLVLEAGPKRVRRKIPISKDNIDAVIKGMYKVVNDSSGTAYKYFHDCPGGELGMDVCGKTGTATVAPQRIRGFVVRRGDMAWFAGFAPHDNPQVAFAVVLEYVQGGGGQNAAPIARELLRICKKRGYFE